jgi:DNA repair protein RadC
VATRRAPGAGVSSGRSIRYWPADEQPREKLFRRGAGALSEAELLAILLRSGHPSTGETALDQARVLVARFGSLRRLDRASVHELCALRGLGPAKAAQLKAALELAKRFHEEPLRAGQTLRSSRDVYRHYQGRLASLRRETFHVVLLDSKNRVIGETKVSEGSLSASIVHPREVFHPVIAESAAAVILVHNHPSGDPAPSAEDLAITKRLREVGDVMGVKVLDHVIIGEGRYTSFVEHGYW